MRLRLSECDLERTVSGHAGARFTAVREQHARIWDDVGPGHGSLQRAMVECRSGEHHPGRVCVTCPHFLAVAPAAAGDGVTIRCMFLDSDPVEAVMTPEPSLRTIDEGASVGAAAAAARLAPVRPLLVMAGDEVVGMATSDELLRDADGHPDERMSARSRAPIPVIPRTASLGEVAQLLRQPELPCLLVVDGDEVAGIVTRDDLRRAGLPLETP